MRNFEAGARAACYDYQGSRVSDEEQAREDFDYELEYGAVGVYVLDLRSNRRAGEDARIYSDRQFRKLRGLLERRARRQLL